jgi:hypothetical protein
MTNIDNIGSIIYQILVYTPWWVYLLFFYLLKIGYKSSKTGIVLIKKMLIMPIIFSIMSLESLVSLPVTNLIIFVYIISLLIGLLLGILQAKLQKPIPDIDKKRLIIPGTWSIMIIILIIFISKYYFGYQAASDPLIIHSNAFIIISGSTTGLFIGKTLYYYWKCYRGPWVDIDKNIDKYPNS